jgi:DNA-binding CsgD family transcriptional regulator
MKKLNEYDVGRIRELYTKQGKSSAEIASQLSLSLPTVKKYVSGLLSLEELNLDYYVVKWLRKIGKIQITEENKTKPFNLTDADIWQIVDEEVGKLLPDNSNIKELIEEYKAKL